MEGETAITYQEASQSSGSAQSGDGLAIWNLTGPTQDRQSEKKNEGNMLV